MKYVLDACALIALIRNEDGASIVHQALAADENICFVHALNLCEVYYDCLRCYGAVQADNLVDRLAEAGLSICSDMDVMLWKHAGHLKARGRISLADCFAIALTERENAVLLTSDRHEFEPLLAVEGFKAKIRFIH